MFLVTLTSFVLQNHRLEAAQQAKMASINTEKITPETLKMLSLFGEVFEKVKHNYVREVSDKELIEAALQGMLNNLDPYSNYFNSKDRSEINKVIKGEFGGLGIEVTMERGLIKVIAPLDDSPATKAGIKAGDYIVKVDNQSVFGMGLQEAVDKIKGKPGTKVDLTIIREGDAEPKYFSIKREVIQTKVVRSERFGNIAYIRVSTFNEKTNQALLDKWRELQKIGKITGLVLDLRNNPGGLLPQAVSMADNFLNEGEIVSIVERNPKKKKVYNATKGDITHGLPMVVLIDQGSASASEIVAGALQDHHRAIIMGSNSFGKGSVQVVIPFDEHDCAVKLTYAMYYTPSGRSIHETGITPDIEVKPAKLEYLEQNANPTNEIFDRYSAKLESGTTEQQKTEERRRELYAKDYVLARAVDLLTGLSTYEQRKLAN